MKLVDEIKELESAIATSLEKIEAHTLEKLHLERKRDALVNALTDAEKKLLRPADEKPAASGTTEQTPASPPASSK